jgi:hypothetical protein
MVELGMRRAALRWGRGVRIGVVLAVVLCLGLGQTTAGAAPAAPLFTDAAGDASPAAIAVALALGSSGPDLRPASIDGVDVVASWFETTYEKTKVRDDAGSVTQVTHRPLALELHIQTSGPASPTFGPTVRFLHYVSVNDCTLRFVADVRGPTSGADDVPQAASLDYSGRGCPTPSGWLAAGSAPEFRSNEMILRFPFQATVIAGTQLVPIGATIAGNPSTNGGFVFVTTDGSNKANLEFINKAARTYVVGAEVPADVDCATDPAHPDCA